MPDEVIDDVITGLRQHRRQRSGAAAVLLSAHVLQPDDFQSGGFILRDAR
jgi:hypothetical protein